MGIVRCGNRRDPDARVNLSKTGRYAVVMSSRATFRTLGMDPGLNITGYAAVDFGRGGPTIVEAGTLKTDARCPS